MELRRALLLFAIVLGLAGIASLVARPPERDDPAPEAQRQSAPRDGGTATPSASAAPSEDHVTIEMSAGARKQVERLQQGRPATLVVSVDTPGQVQIPGLGLVQPAEPLTPARFELLVREPAAYDVLLRPAASSAPVTNVGSLKVVAAR